MLTGKVLSEAVMNWGPLIRPAGGETLSHLPKILLSAPDDPDHTQIKKYTIIKGYRVYYR